MEGFFHAIHGSDFGCVFEDIPIFSCYQGRDLQVNGFPRLQGADGKGERLPGFFQGHPGGYRKLHGAVRVAKVDHDV